MRASIAKDVDGLALAAMKRQSFDDEFPKNQAKQVLQKKAA
jgi:hypothetical protein